MTGKTSAGMRRFLMFMVAGGLAALVNILSRLILSQAIPFGISVVVAYLIGMTAAFLMNKFFVFENSGRSPSSEYLRFSIVNLAALVQVWGVSMLLARVVFPYFNFDWHAETVAHVSGVLSPVLVSYYGHKKFSFGRVKTT
jgi:putative flippase GtrA